MLVILFTIMLPALAVGAENLRLNSHLNYKKNNHQGPLIMGKHMTEGMKRGVVNYIVFYAEFCYNAKRQARTTVDLYQKYKGRVHFVVVDYEYGWSPAQNKLVQEFFTRYIPHIVILDRQGRPVFNYIGQAPESTLEQWLNAALERSGQLPLAKRPMDTPGSVPGDHWTIARHLGIFTKL